MVRDTIELIPYTLPTGTDLFIVTITLTESQLYYGELYHGSADKTLAEINTAYETGKDVFALVNNQYLPFNNGNLGFARFSILKNTSDTFTEIRLLGLDDPTCDVWTFEAVRHYINNPNLAVQEFSSGWLSFSAGTIGTRGVQTTLSIAKSGYTPIGVFISYIENSNMYHPLVFFNPEKTIVYVNLYRASDSSYSGYPVRFTILYQSN